VRFGVASPPGGFLDQRIAFFAAEALAPREQVAPRRLTLGALRVGRQRSDERLDRHRLPRRWQERGDAGGERTSRDAALGRIAARAQPVVHGTQVGRMADRVWIAR